MLPTASRETPESTKLFGDFASVYVVCSVLAGSGASGGRVRWIRIRLFYIIMMLKSTQSQPTTNGLLLTDLNCPQDPTGFSASRST